MQGRARHRERTVRRRHLGSGGRPQTPEPDCGPRTQIACHAITANECRRQRVDGPAGYGLPLRHARPGELTCRYGITAGQEHIRGAAAPLPGTSRCEESANRVFSTLHNTSYRRSTHGVLASVSTPVRPIWTSHGCSRPRRAGGDGRAESPRREPGTFLRARRRRHRVKSVR